ncbi:MAG: hypothetical protein KF799_05320 [Bdellovibrionales bacterium]|nr:hypothetical protein [Bdellovibrionales bacterium]
MIYSGADLIRNSSALTERLERLETQGPSVQPVAAPENPKGSLDEQSQNSALLRFARFVHKEGEKKKRRPKRGLELPSSSETKPSLNPYRAAEEREGYLFGRGQSLDVYI